MLPRPVGGSPDPESVARPLSPALLWFPCGQSKSMVFRYGTIKKHGPRYGINFAISGREIYRRKFRKFRFGETGRAVPGFNFAISGREICRRKFRKFRFGGSMEIVYGDRIEIAWKSRMEIAWKSCMEIGYGNRLEILWGS